MFPKVPKFIKNNTDVRKWVVVGRTNLLQNPSFIFHFLKFLEIKYFNMKIFFFIYKVKSVNFRRTTKLRSHSRVNCK